MRKHSRCLLSLALLVLLAGSAWAFNVNATAPRYLAYVPDEYLPTVDGNLNANEWDWVPSAFVYRLSDFLTADANSGPHVVVGDASNPYSAADFDVPFVFLGWNPTINGIIIAVQTVDDVNYTIQPYFETWRTMDSIYWYMDANGSGGQYQYYDPARTGEEGQQGIFRPDPDRGGRPDLPAFGQYGVAERGAWAFREPYTRTGITFDPATGSYTLEATMQVWDWLDEGGPSASTLHQLEAGQILGMRFNIVDQDSDNENDFIQFTWNSVNPGVDNAFTSDAFEQFILLSPEQTFGSVTAVESQSWGQVKASAK